MATTNKKEKWREKKWGLKFLHVLLLPNIILLL